MKKVFALLTLAALTLFVSCGDDDTQTTNSNDTIVGSWRYIGSIEPTGEFNPDEDEADCYDEVATFNKNGTGVAVLLDCEEGDENNTFKWKKEATENIYKVTFDEDNVSELLTVKFEGQNKMKIFYDEVEADVYERVIPFED